MKDFKPRDASIYRPYPDEVPWELLSSADGDEDRVRGYADIDYMRVAKHRDQVVGVYVVQALEPTRYALKALVVTENYRRRRLGSWLLGHAIGLAESKGAREIEVPGAPLRGFFRRVGFEETSSGLLLVLTPE